VDPTCPHRKPVCRASRGGARAREGAQLAHPTTAPKTRALRLLEWLLGAYPELQRPRNPRLRRLPRSIDVE